MHNYKRVLSVTAALALTMSLGLTALAAESHDISAADGTGSVPVELTAEAATFSVTVPVSLPINIAADGTVTTATDAKIVNNGHGAVKVSALEVAGANDWATADYDTLNTAAEKVGTKKVGMTINGDKTTGVNTISFTQSNFPVLAGANDTDNDELAITYGAKVPAQAVAVTGQTVANIVFTIGWDA